MTCFDWIWILNVIVGNRYSTLYRPPKIFLRRWTHLFHLKLSLFFLIRLVFCVYQRSKQFIWSLWTFQLKRVAIYNQLNDVLVNKPISSKWLIHNSANICMVTVTRISYNADMISAWGHLALILEHSLLRKINQMKFDSAKDSGQSKYGYKLHGFIYWNKVSSVVSERTHSNYHRFQ